MRKAQVSLFLLHYCSFKPLWRLPFQPVVKMCLRVSQASWERRIVKSLNSMSTELGVPLARMVKYTQLGWRYTISNWLMTPSGFRRRVLHGCATLSRFCPAEACDRAAGAQQQMERDGHG